MTQTAQISTDRKRAIRLRVRLTLPIAIAALLLALELAAILWLGAGRFSYTLDDAYIHLAVAEELARGGYGINPGEFAAPASSILWPALLAPFAPFEWHLFVPLLLNIGALLGCVALLCRLFGTALQDRATTALRNGLAIILPLAAGLVPIAFTGMEHLLQAWLGLRYESLALTLPLAALLWRGGYRRQVAATLGALALCLAAFSALLLSHGLPPLPSSVLSKAGSAGADLSLARSLLSGLGRQFAQGEGWLLLALMLALLSAAALLRRCRGLALALAGATALHLCFGLTRTSFGRYEAYILILDLAFLAMLAAPRLADLAKARGSALALIAAGLLLTPLWPTALARLATVPLAADNIASQQREMRRFATEFWGGPVAVNDLGWVSYRNDAYVLDLWGLGYEEARRRRISGERGWAEELLRRRDVALMMVYDGWLGREVPPGWVPMGRLVLTRKRMSPAEAEVGFYARPDRAQELADAVRRFAAGLPEGATFRFPG
ncbi:MAG: putative rane protein of unknown function [Rhodospirillales bacterium]|nr:putative rane protein of unknown function [Rhodospirillales bacterium]